MIDPGFWRGRRVLLTGHTGFKGAWLALWLAQLGARVTGFGGPPPSDPSLYALARVQDVLHDAISGDVRDAPAVQAAVRRVRPEVVLHLAAQALVRRGLRDPVGTYAVNVMGTVHLLEAVRQAGEEVRAVLCVTSDKCYAEGDAERAHREDDALGGRDPYASSKACQELVTQAYRDSLLAAMGVRVATARAGNVIGGGDWAQDRLIPDLVRAAAAGAPLEVRSPAAVRPWQHVLNPLAGYLALVQGLCAPGGEALDGAWNFGPAAGDARPVRWLVERLCERWPDRPEVRYGDGAREEAAVLRVDAARARARLRWAPALDLASGLDATMSWYVAQGQGAPARGLCEAQIAAYGAGGG